MRLLGKSGSRALSKVMMLLLAAIGVMMVRRGIIEIMSGSTLFNTLHSMHWSKRFITAIFLTVFSIILLLSAICLFDRDAFGRQDTGALFFARNLSRWA